MPQQTINIGSNPNDGLGDPLRTAFDKCNDNFTELYAVGTGDVSGPTSSTDKSIARFNGTNGKLIQDSAATIADTTGDITAGKFNGVTISGSGSFSGTSSGTNTGDQTITLTGDVTGSGTGSFAATIASAAVTYAKIQNVSATDKLLGRSTAGPGTVEEITCTAAGRALIDDVDASAQRTTLGLGTAATKDIPATGNASSTQVVYGTDTRLSDSRTPTAHASTHGSAGSDPITIAQSQVTNLTTDLSAKAPLASPTFTGIPAAPTAVADTNTTQVATTAYVVGQASATTPAALGTAAVGTSLKYARADHVHALPTINLATGVTGTLPVANGGTGITSLGTGVATWLGTPSSANLAAAITDETGSGALVFGTAPTISGAILTGQAIYDAGTVTAPSITTTGDTNNGIYFPAADNIAFTTNGNERLRIDSGGLVGIGATPTFYKFHIRSSSGVMCYFDSSATTTGAANTGVSFLFAGHTGVSAINLGQINVFKENSTSGNSASLMSFQTRANGGALTDRLTISSGGNIIVGTAAIATTATDGFIYIPTCPGAPTGTPTTVTGRSPLVVDSTNNRFYVYVSGAWKYATLT